MTVLAAALSACTGASHAPRADVESTGVRITMADLHRFGGIPHGWQFRLPPGDPQAGRKAFVDFGCFTCHRVRGENFPAAEPGAAAVGPDLSAMGSHHPASYFAESIVNPNAVLVDGPGYIGPDGRSIMPAYPDMTLAQLSDLVAYLQSLTGEGGDTRRLTASPGGATDFFVQAYDIDPDKVGDLYDWFDRQGFRDYDGLVSIDTYIGRSSGRQLVIVAILGFDNEVSLGRFLRQLGAPPSGATAIFVQPEHVTFRSPPVYKATGLLLP